MSVLAYRLFSGLRDSESVNFVAEQTDMLGQHLKKVPSSTDAPSPN